MTTSSTIKDDFGRAMGKFKAIYRELHFLATIYGRVDFKPIREALQVLADEVEQWEKREVGDTK